jgi:hypothetical protein
MNTAKKYLSDYVSEKQTELFNKTGAFFAFSEKQYLDQCKEGVVYSSLNHGMICPTDNIDELTKGLETIYYKGMEEDLKDHTPAEIISREYFNHECHIGNTEDAIHALYGYIETYPNLFTKELLSDTFEKCYLYAIENF